MCDWQFICLLQFFGGEGVRILWEGGNNAVIGFKSFEVV